MVLDAIIPAFIASLVFAATDLLRDSLRSSIHWLRGSEDAIRLLNQSLNKFQSVVSRAEKTSRGSAYLELVQLEFRDLLYDIDDILDEISYESLKKKVKAEQAAATVNRKRKFEMLLVAFMHPDSISFKIFNSRQIIARMSEKTAALDEWTDRVFLHVPLEPNTGGPINLGETVPTSSYSGERHTFGRDEDQCKLVDFLLADFSYYAVMAVIGMAGIGKTTLAQLAFNDSKVDRYFDVKAWIHVSHNFDMLRLTKSMIESIEGQMCNDVGLDALQRKLHDLVRYKRIIIVLDDVWNENIQLWQVFASPLRGENIKIIVTTQNESAAAIMQTVPPLKLKLLPEDECVRMLKDVVGLENDFPELLKAASLNMKTCQGLPLALKELARRLCNVTRLDTHDGALADFNPAIEFATGMFTSLKFSYDMLPANLKRCIAYCTVFPTDYVYKRDQMARMWAVQGFVQFERGATSGYITRFTREDVCLGYFDELVRRSFFLAEDSTDDQNNDPSGYKMHNLIHRLCKYVSANEIGTLPSSKELRHVFIASPEPELVPGHVPLRTYIYHHCNGQPDSQFIFPEILFLNLKYVRTVELDYPGIWELPNSIGSLKYLKYLRVNGGIMHLPQSIGNLYNLQVLDLRGCKRLRGLPPSIANLIELWFLGLPPVELREETCHIPSGIGRLTSLRTLPGIVLSGELDNGSVAIQELKRLVNLRGELYIAGLASVTHVKDHIDAYIKSMEFLQILRLKWREPSESSESAYPYPVRFFGPPLEHLERRLLENLEPHKNLIELVIIGYGELNFPRWLCASSLSNLTKMTLIGCRNNFLVVLPELGQLPFLKSLSIGWMPHLRGVGVEFCCLQHNSLLEKSITSTFVKSFPCLVELSFEEMRRWEYWNAIGERDFPALRKLTIKNCQNLMDLPDFPRLTDLILIGCDGLKSYLMRNDDHYRQLLGGKKTQVDKLLELPQSSSGVDKSLPYNEKHTSTGKGLLLDENHANFEADQPICGREDEANRILKVLLSKEYGEHNVTSMCIVAPSGVGKTTITHHVYNNYTVSEAFDKRIWLSISRVHSEDTLMKEIIESLTHLSCIRADLALLHEIVKEELSGKKFLLILDGAQNENKSFWSSVFTVLDTGAQGSMVVVATKSEDVADAIGSNHCYSLSTLSYDSCWSIFRSLNPNLPSRFIERCRPLVEKCKGIPLCVKMIGGCFHDADVEEIIMALTESESWKRNEFCGEILPALRVCYKFLPFELTKIFASFALFPKHHVFVKDHIVCMWMSQGLLDHVMGEEAEVVGSQYFDELVARSFLCISPFHDVKDGMFIMHEHVHDLAECISRNECFRSEDCLEDVPGNISHLSLVPREFRNIELNMVTSEISNLETFLVVNRFIPRLYNNGLPLVNLLGLNDVFEKHRNIKTLDLSDTDIKELPESIGLLKSLRFLGISNTKVKKIPPEICILPKLQTLEARNCCDLVELPTNLKELTSLRHLDIRKESDFVAIPSGIGHLTNLRTLPLFNIGNEKSNSSIRELKYLTHLKGELHITGIENVKSGNEAEVAELEKKSSLESLVLEWCGSTIGDETGIISKDVLGSLVPPSNLQHMVIRNYAGSEFPVWMGYRFLPKLVSVTLDNCFNCNKFPILGNALQNIRFLCAQKMHRIRTLSACKAGDLPKFEYLEVLKLSEMYALEDLFQLKDGDFPRLHSLYITRCPMLGKIPGFPSLVELSLSCCTELPDISDLSSLQFLKIDRVENLELLDLRHRLPLLKKVEISNCKELSSVLLPDGTSTVTKIVRCPKLDCNIVRVTDPNPTQGEFPLVANGAGDSERSFEQHYEEIDDDLLEDY